MDTGFDVIDEKADNVSLNMIEYKFSLEQGNIAETGEGSIQLESSLSADTGQITFLMQEDWEQIKHWLKSLLCTKLRIRRRSRYRNSVNIRRYT